MKNFKKVIAFLMVAAMTLGMGLTAFADDSVKTDCFTVGKVEEAKAGDIVKLEVVAARDLSINGITLVFELNTDYVEASADAIKAIEQNGYDDTFKSWGVWKLPTTGEATFNETDSYGGRDYTNVFVIGAIGTGKAASAPAGTVVAEVYVKLAKDLPAGETVATISAPIGITDDIYGAEQADGKKKLFMDDIKVVAVEKATETIPDPEPTPEPTPDPNPTPAPTTAAPAPTTAAPATTTAAAKAVTNNDEALNAMNTLDKAVSVANKLNKSAFSSDADFQAFQNALKSAQAVLNNPNATAEQKAAALKALKDAMAKAKAGALVTPTNDALKLAAPATTKAGNGKTKTGDTAPVAALVLVAIAAFGTAVVVYRKKVNA